MTNQPDPTKPMTDRRLKDLTPDESWADNQLVEWLDVKDVRDLIAEIERLKNALVEQKVATEFDEAACDLKDKRIGELEKENQELREALKPFCPGTDPIPWGKIKAHLPTELARLLTSFNVRAEWANQATTETKNETI